MRRRRGVNRILFALVALLLTPSILAQRHAEYEKEPNGPHGDCPVNWLRVDSGLDYRTIRCLGDPDDVDVHVVRIDTAAWKLDTAVGRPRSVRDVAAERRAPFAMNANFFGSAREPLGLVVQGGDVVNPLHDSSWQSVFLLKTDGGPRIILPDAWKSYRTRTAAAVQAGPRLVVKGKRADIRNTYSAARCGVCIRATGELFFFATPQDRKLSMYEIGRIARRSEEDGGLACHDAMLFDGGHSVNFHLEGDAKQVDVSGDPVPVVIYATRK